MNINENVTALPENYVFTALRKKVAAFYEKTGIRPVDLGVGDVRLPLFEKTIAAMKTACDELGDGRTFRGYPPSEGYAFLREKISRFVYGGKIVPDEIFVTDGAKGELGGAARLFARGSKVCFPTPSYPAGAEANVLLGNSVYYLKTDLQSGFLPFPPRDKTFDLIYLCSPSNPCGSVMSRELIAEWVDYAIESGAVIIFDAAYSAFAAADEPKSVYEIPRADECAIEINSFSKSLGFTGVRCGYTVVPKKTGRLYDAAKRVSGVNTNGVSYVSQRGAETFFDEDVQAQLKIRIDFYKTNADVIKNALKTANLWYNNGRSSPYVFSSCPDGQGSEAFCDELLEKYGVVATPGNGFLSGGEGFVRFSAFCTRTDALTFYDRFAR